MKKIAIILFLLICLVSENIYAQKIIQSDSIHQNDGPYVLKRDQRSEMINISEGEIVITEIEKLPPTLQIKTANSDNQFEVELYSPTRPNWQHDMPDSLLILSDPHANFEAFSSVLKAHHVINDQFDWIYGNGHLMVIGDVFDRGDDVLPIYWLLYKLDLQAQQVGGQLHFLYGNHEDMVLRNNLKYTNEKYKELANLLKIDYSQLWERNSILGEWLYSKNTMEVIGDILFVHAGISPQVLDLGLSIPDMNSIVSQYIGIPKTERKENEIAEFLFSNEGILWYRGMVKTDKKYNPITEDQLDKILNHFGVNQIIVGHTIFDDISSLFGGKVVTVNVSNQKNMDNKASRGLLIKNGQEFIIFDDNTKFVPL